MPVEKVAVQCQSSGRMLHVEARCYQEANIPTLAYCQSTERIEEAPRVETNG